MPGAVAAVLPFLLLLVALAGAPLAFPERWERNHTKALVVTALAVPALAHVLLVGAGLKQLGHAGRDYISFVAYLGALYVIASGIRLRLSLEGTPRGNVLLLLVGAVLASVVGTAGASLLLARPLLEANRGRRDPALAVVFFIFVVANGGGLLSPLGDPPLYLGFLRGVPFFWPLENLFLVWATFTGLTIGSYWLIARLRARHEPEPGASPTLAPPVASSPEGPRLEGGSNVFLLLLVVAASFFSGKVGAWWAGPLAFTVLAGTSLLVRPPSRRDGFSWHPLIEVAIVFAGVFATLAPVLALVQKQGSSLPQGSPLVTFLVAGGLSSVLDNAPTYLVLVDVARTHTEAGAATVGAVGVTGPFLAAISCGCVLMGANTYVGNGPNLLVRSLAEREGVRMPGFFRYSALALAVLGPIYVVIALAFFR